MIIFGTRGFGQTDQVPGVFYVKTLFFHIDFIPLIPIKSYVILEAGAGGINIPINKDSLFAAWSRAFAWVMTLIMVITTIAITADPDGSMDSEALLVLSPFTIFFLGLAIFLQFHPWFRNATYERATEICSSLGTEGQRLQPLVDKHFGMDQLVMAEATISNEESDYHDDEEIPIAKAADLNQGGIVAGAVTVLEVV